MTTLSSYYYYYFVSCCLLFRIEFSNAWLPYSSRTVHARSHSSRSWLMSSQNNNNDKDEEDEPSGVGMERAFQQLERLSFLPNETTNSNINNTTKIQASVQDLPPSQATTPEQEVEIYKNMVQELEQTTEEDLYSTVLQDMGGTSSKDNDNEQPTEKQPTEKQQPKTSADLLNQALAEALQQVQVNNPSAVDSILDDPVLLNEIDAIFERGNAKLLEGLEAVRREQEQLTQASIQQAQEEPDARLEAAERSMQAMLNRVNQERSNVEQAVQDLQRAQEQETNVLLNLKQSPVKQGALIGFLLFTFRSLAESYAALSSGDPSEWTVALVQGAIALVCAAVFYLL